MENPEIKPSILLVGLKCIIILLQEGLLTAITKIYGLRYDPYKYEDELEINIHILEVYKTMIEQMEPRDMLNIMMPKLEPYLVKEEVADELFFKAKKCVQKIMARLTEIRDLNPDEDVEVDYDREFF